MPRPLFIETNIPLNSSVNSQLALRYENRGEFDSLDPKVGLVWLLNDSISLRGSYSTSFKAPSQFQEAGGLTTPARVSDPNAGNRLVTVSQRTEGDPDNPLTAEESTNFNLGLAFNLGDSDWVANIDYWSFDYTDFITPENATAVVQTDPNGDQVTRDPGSGTLLAVRTFFRNAGALETDGIDISTAKTFYLGESSLKLSFETTYINSYDLDDPVLGDVDGKGQRNFTNFGSPAPEWRGNIGILWQMASHSANVRLNYIGSYTDENNDGSVVDNEIDSFATLDLLYRYDIESLFGYDDTFSFALGAKNVTDQMPPDVISRTGYDPRTHNPFGRQVHFSFAASFE